MIKYYIPIPMHTAKTRHVQGTQGHQQNQNKNKSWQMDGSNSLSRWLVWSKNVKLDALIEKCLLLAIAVVINAHLMKGHRAQLRLMEVVRDVVQIVVDRDRN